MVDRVGQQFGNYQLLSLLGQGGFAEVYLGEHIYLNNLAAIKLLHAHLVGKDAEHFLAEAKTLVELVHPNIVRVLDFAVHDGLPFLIMEYVSGGTLRQQHPKGSRLPLELVVRYIKQVASALQYAHDRQLIHRDVKPENMLLGKAQAVVLSDFGIATVAQRSDTLTEKKDVGGTPHYMAPEQIDGHPLVASDQYALGVVAYEWLCGELPFRGSALHIMAQHKSRPIPPLRDKNSELPHDVEKVVLKALAKDALQRYASVQEFADALEHAYQQELSRTVPLHSSTVSLPITTPPRAMSFITSNIRSLPRPVSRRTVIMALGGVALAGGVAGGAWLLNTFRIAQSPHPLIYRGHVGAVRTVAWAPGGKSLASAGEDSSVQIWDTTTLKTLFTYRGHSDRVNSVAWSPPSGKYVASASQDGTSQVWEATTGRNVFPSSDHAAIAASWSHDGKYVAIGYDETIQVWEAASGNIISVFTHHVNTVLTTSWSPDGTLIASGSADGTMYLWEVATGDVRMSSTRKFALQAVAWSSNGNIALGYKDGYIAAVDATSKRTIFSSPGTQAVQAVLWSPDGMRLAALDQAGTVLLWDIAPGKPQLHLKYTSYTSMSIAWSPDGTQIVSGGNDGTAQIWEAATGKTLATYQSDLSSVQTIAWSPDGSHIACGGSSNELHVWNATNGAAQFTCGGSFNRAWTISWLNGGKQIAAAGDDNNVYLWDATTGTTINTYGKTGPVQALAWSPHGTYLALADNKLARIKKVSTATVTTAYLAGSMPVQALSWSSDGQYVATGGADKRVYIWSALSDENIAIYRHLSTVNALAWSPQSKFLASGSGDRSVQVWDLATLAVLSVYQGHSAAVNAVAWSPDGKYVASGSSDMTVQVWVAATGKLVFTYRGHKDKVNAVAWSPDGKHIASGSSDATIQVWSVNN
jgi:WD40 repeat protein